MWKGTGVGHPFATADLNRGEIGREQLQDVAEVASCWEQSQHVSESSVFPAVTGAGGPLVAQLCHVALVAVSPHLC